MLVRAARAEESTDIGDDDRHCTGKLVLSVPGEILWGALGAALRALSPPCPCHVYAMRLHDRVKQDAGKMFDTPAVLKGWRVLGASGRRSFPGDFGCSMLRCANA